MVTVKQLAEELNTDPRRLRRFLRAKFPRPEDQKQERYEFDEATANAVKGLYLKHVEELQAKREEEAWLKEQEAREKEEGISLSVAKMLKKRNKR